MYAYITINTDPGSNHHLKVISSETSPSELMCGRVYCPTPLVFFRCLILMSVGWGGVQATVEMQNKTTRWSPGTPPPPSYCPDRETAVRAGGPLHSEGCLKARLQVMKATHS